MIHSGLELNFKSSSQVIAQHCCLRKTKFPIDVSTNFWENSQFHALRELNKKNQWDPGCSNCQSLEQVNQVSFRTGMNHGLVGRDFDVSGPKRIDLMFDISCNLACRTCGPMSSTFWQKYLKSHGQWNEPVSTARRKSEVISALSNIDLSNLRMLVFCGGETLLGQEYWDVADWIVNNVPNAKENLTLCFQTNGTQTINPKNFDIIEKCFLVKLHVSVDGIGDQFEYLRWPASWHDVVENLNSLRQNLPSNVMFLIEETISIFNLAYTSRLDDWVKQNFSTNRERDNVNHTKHLAHGVYSLNSMSSDYVNAIKGTDYEKLIPANFKENSNSISAMIKEIIKNDQLRNQDFTKTFPLMADFYAKWL